MMKWIKDFLKANQDKKILIMPIGISGSGKTTFFNELKEEFNIAYVSFDKIRVEHFLKNFSEYKDKPVSEIYKKTYFYASESKLKPLKIAKKQILETDKNIVYVDNTNLKKKTRNKILHIANGFLKLGIYFNVELKEAIERQTLKDRDKYISPKLIKEQIKMKEEPDLKEFNLIIKKGI